MNSSAILARENVTNWYIQNFDSEIVVNKDSSLDITEKITADCGNAIGKHGIFRVLPEEVRVSDGSIIKSPVKLMSITDFNGKSVKYTESKSNIDKTVTWKIGDANKTVQGVNYYEIKYHVKNVIRSRNPEFDEFYWNLNGNFWDIETDKFHAKIIFPEEVDKDKSQVDYYTGQLGSKYKNQARYEWTAPNILEFDSIGTLKIGDGITASVTFPKNIFIPYVPGLWELYGKYLWLILPIISLIYCFDYWRKYGRDPKVDKTIIAQYDPPGNLTPVEMGIVDNGAYYSALTTAEIVNLAVMGLMTIKETSTKILLFNVKDYELVRKYDQEKEKRLIPAQKRILDKLFRGGDKINLSDLRSTFPAALGKIEDDAMRSVQEKNLITSSGEKKMSTTVMIGIFVIIAAIGMFVISVNNDFSTSGYISFSLLLSGITIIFFGVLMRKRTPEGAELAWEIKGFKLFMETVDKDRAKFYEKENIFERMLPYAIAFEMTDEWIGKMKQIYGDDFAKHAPAWYVGTSGVSSFDADGFSKSLSALSSSISSNTSSSSGSGGGGSSGGGGGGGGGGGW